MTDSSAARPGKNALRAVALAVSSCLVPHVASGTTATFAYTGADQQWTVPAGITSVTFDLFGAEGGTALSPGYGIGGLGGRATATLPVTPGETLEIRVGGSGGSGGYNGGGSGGLPDYPGGGGATDVRQGGTTLTDRVLVAGGGGGSGGCSGSGGTTANGGSGGGLVGGDATPNVDDGGCGSFANSGKGGTQSAGGAGGTGASAGTFGQGGDAVQAAGFYRGGGGGGWYGGGGGAGSSGGGGGSGFGPGSTVFETGVRAGDGLATIVFDSRLDVGTDGLGSGFVTSGPAGIDCETGAPGHADCSALFPHDTPVTLTANPIAGSFFVGWGGACSGTGGCIVTMDQERTVTATFGALDFGDAADPTFPTLLASDGARHVLGSSVYLGTCVDADVDGQPSAAAAGDDLAVGSSTIGACAVPGDDEDGVVFAGQVVAGTSAAVDVTASGPCTLSAWIDFDGDGDWTDAGDDLFPGGTVLAAEVNPLVIAVPAGAVSGAHPARFRCTTLGAVSFTGEAPDGEVEDLEVVVYSSPAALAGSKVGSLLVDADGDGLIEAGDTLAYTVTIENGGGAPALAVVFEDSPDPNTTLVIGSVTTTAGTVVLGNTPGDTGIRVDVGDVGGGVSVTVTYHVAVNDPLPAGPTAIVNQGLVTATNHAAVPTDDPAEAGTADATVLSAVGAAVVEIPALGDLGLGVLAALLAMAGLAVRRA